jgi:hypothetical protein
MPSTASPTRETLSSVCEFKDKQISHEKHSGELIIVDPTTRFFHLYLFFGM